MTNPARRNAKTGRKHHGLHDEASGENSRVLVLPDEGLGPFPQPRTKGRFVKGHPGPRLKHGKYSRLVARAELPEQAEVRLMLAEREAKLVAHVGGPNPVKGELVKRFIETGVIADWLGHNITSEGVLTTKGKTRAAVTTYLHVVDRVLRLAVALGLEPSADVFDVDPATWLAQTREAQTHTD